MTTTDYQRDFVTDVSAEEILRALTTLEGLTAWWTEATGEPAQRGDIRFWFDKPKTCLVRVDKVESDAVAWTVLECDFLPDWVDTNPRFTLATLADQRTRVTFRHHGLTTDLECIDMCTRGWDHYLTSLQRYVETGTGSPRLSAADQARRLHENQGDT